MRVSANQRGKGHYAFLWETLNLDPVGSKPLNQSTQNCVKLISLPMSENVPQVMAIGRSAVSAHIREILNTKNYSFTFFLVSQTRTFTGRTAHRKSTCLIYAVFEQ
jgi:hypothetical protein